MSVTTIARTASTKAATAAKVAGASAVAAALALGAFSTAASADVNLYGAYFHTTIDCGASWMQVATNTQFDSGSYEKIAVYSYSTARWYYETQWHDASAWSFSRTADFNLARGRYSVYVYYAQWTNNGWRYSGESITSYNQHSGYSTYRSSACYIG